LNRKIAARRFFLSIAARCAIWVRALSGDYQIYVSNPIGEIKSLTGWRFVPVVLNPADAATRSHLNDRAISAWWLEGPPFLYQEDSAWSQNLPWTLERAEMRGARTHLSDVVAETTVSFDWKTVQIAPGKVPTLIRLGDKYLNLVRRCQRETQVAHRLWFRSVTDLFLRVCKLFGVKHFYRLSYRSVTDP
jgi:hypothetical protein